MGYGLSLRQIDHDDLVLYFIYPISKAVIQRYLSVLHKTPDRLMMVPDTMYISNDDFFKQLKNMSDVYKITQKNFTMAVMKMPALVDLINDEIIEDGEHFT